MADYGITPFCLSAKVRPLGAPPVNPLHGREILAAFGLIQVG